MKKEYGGLIDFFAPYPPLGMVLLFLLFPFCWTFVAPIRPKSELYGSVVTYWLQNMVSDSCYKLFVGSNFIKPMENSLLTAGVTTLISPLVSMLAAYTFSRFHFPGRKTLMIVFSTDNMLLTVLPLTPLCSIVCSMGVPYIPIALILPYTTSTILFSVWLLNDYLNDFPESLGEAAIVDGAGRSQALVRIIFPVLIPYPVATGAYISMTSRSEYTLTALFINETSRTIPMALKSLISQLGVQWDLLTVDGIITIIPVYIMFFLAQRRSVAELTAGTVKR